MTAVPRVLVLGGQGRVARQLRRVWASDPSCPALLVQSRTPGTGVDLVCDPEAGIADKARARIIAFAPDLVLCLWGAVPGTCAPDFDLNRTLALIAHDLARSCGIPRLVALSSGAVYGAGDGVAFSETASLAGTSPYALSKIRMEDALAAETGVAVACLRLANLFGADQLAEAMARATGMSPLRLDQFADGTGPVRSYASARLLAAVIAELAQGRADTLPPVLNVADTDGGVAMQAVLEALAVTDRPVPWSWQPAPVTALKSHILDCTRLWEHFPQLKAQRCADAATLVALAGGIR